MARNRWKRRWTGPSLVLILYSMLWGFGTMSVAFAGKIRPTWTSDCEGGLILGPKHVPTLLWSKDLSQKQRTFFKNSLNHPAFGLSIPDDWREKTFASLPQFQRMNEYYGAWLGVFGGAEKELVTHRVLMPTGVTFERIAFHEGSGNELVLPTGESLRDPGFGPLGVAWRVLSSKEGALPSLLWSATLPGKYTWEEAVAACARWGGRLPTKEEYETLFEQLGWYEPRKYQRAVNNLLGFEEKYYWSASLVPEENTRNYDRDGRSAYFMGGFSWGLSPTLCSFPLVLVRCVR